MVLVGAAWEIEQELGLDTLTQKRYEMHVWVVSLGPCFPQPSRRIPAALGQGLSPTLRVTKYAEVIAS